MSGFLANFFNRRAGQQQASAPQANPAGQFDFLLSQYHNSVKGLETEHLKLKQANKEAKEEYQQMHKAYLSAKDALDTSQKKLLDINAEINNLRQDVATKEMAIGELTSQVEALRQSVCEVENSQREQRALFKKDCNKLITEAM
ncbi:hypothetical protein KSW81_004539 [Nannochloris sp. 'desiccata']|nr:hypothetical protein KSW81_004539 [Chlorella desiccata (nom. nud.)]